MTCEVLFYIVDELHLLVCPSRIQFNKWNMEFIGLIYCNLVINFLLTLIS